MRKTRGFTLIELLVVISIIALLIGILLPALGAARRAARQMQNSGQIRGVHTGMTIYAQGNDGFFPGRTAGSQAPTKQRVTVPATPQTGLYVQSRFRELLEDRYFTGEYINAPTDRRVPWTSGDVKLEHYSYAMAHFRSQNNAAGLITLAPDFAGPNMAEWAETTNSEAVVLSDRAIRNGTGIRSVHTQPENNTTDWRGSVGWNDGHVTFEGTHIVRTRHSTVRTDEDALFDVQGVYNGGNAAMVFHHYVAYSGDFIQVVRPFAAAATNTSSLIEP